MPPNTPPNLAWEEHERKGGVVVSLKQPRATNLVLLVIAIIVLAWTIAHLGEVMRVTDAVDQAYRPRRYLTQDPTWVGALPYMVGAVGLIIIYRAISGLRDTAQMRIDADGFMLRKPFALPRRAAVTLALAQIVKFEPAPGRGFAGDLIPLGQRWTVRAICHEREVPLDLTVASLEEAQFVAHRLNRLIARSGAMPGRIPL